MWSQRSVIDYSLIRRATLESLFRGGTHSSDACDADPYLLRAAKFHGAKTDRACPVCRKKGLVELNYTFGEQLGQYSGRIKALDELEAMAHEYGEFRVYVVEVCRDCGWNHIISSYLLGDGVDRKPPRRQKTIEDED